MKFKIDENLPIEIAELLNPRGYHAKTVIEEELGGEKDTTIASICLKEQRTLITLDVDFADIRTYPPHKYPGILVMRLKRQDKPYLLSFFTGLFKVLQEEPIIGRLWIVDEERIRIRD